MGTSCICSDKTGTLTQNIMTVAQVVYDTNGAPKIQDAGSSFTKGISTYDTDSAGFKALVKCSTLCNTCNFDKYFEDEVTGKRVLLPFSKVRVQGDGSTITEILWKTRGNASEGAMIKFAQGCPIQACFGKRDVDEMRRDYGKVFDIPFNSKNKYQVHVHYESADPESDDNDRTIYMKGAPERIIDRCTQYMTGDGKVVEFTAELRAEVEKAQMAMGNNGLRVLGFCTKTWPIKQYGKAYPWSDGRDLGKSTANFPLGEAKAIASYKSGMVDDKGKPLDPPHPKSGEGLIFLGLMALVDPPREAVPGAVAKCKTAGIKVIMVTGDHPGTAEAIAYKVGILWSPTARKIEEMNAAEGLQPGDVGYQDPALAQAIVVPGWEISDDDPVEKWDAILDHPQIVFARTSPQQKLVIVGNCQRVGHVVAVTGDGVNDSPALKKADIGVAMGIAGTPVTKNAADMILLDDNFASIVAGVEEGRLIFDNLKKSIAYTLSSNIPEIAPFICFITIFMPLPLSTVLILCVDLGTDMIPAISMAWENKESDIMLRPPREAGKDRLVTKKLVVFSYLQIGVIQAVAGFYTWFVVMYDYGYPAHILPRLGLFDAWGKQLLWCKPNSDTSQFRGYRDGVHRTYAQVKASIANGDGSSAILKNFPFLDDGVKECTYAPKTFNGDGSSPTGRSNWNWVGITNDYDDEYSPGSVMSETGARVLEAAGFVPYIPWRAVKSPFFRGNWMKMSFDKDLGAIGFGSASTDIMAMYQPGGYYELIKSVYSEDSADCGSHSRCCGFNDAQNNFVRTIPFDENLGGNLGGSGDKMDNVKDIFADDSCQATFKCGNETVTASCDLYDVSFKSYHRYKTDIDCNNTVIDGVTMETFPTYETVCDTRMDGTDCGNGYCANVASRNIMKEALHHAQCAYFVSIVIVQWADLVICKTRMNSIYHQGMLNPAMNYGLIFETLLAAILCYTPGLTFALGTRPLKFVHWMPGVPYSIFIFLYDETRKKIMRHQAREATDKQTGQVIRYPGWVERNTYY